MQFFTKSLNENLQKKDTLAAYAKMALTAKAFREVELVSIDAFEVNGRHSFYEIQGEQPLA